MKIIGVALALHVFVLVIIFANPGCSSTRRPTEASDRPAPSDSMPATITVPVMTPAPSSLSTVAVNFDPNAPAIPAGSSRSTPRRPGMEVSAPPAAPAPMPEAAPTRTYTVVSGDSLWVISRANNITAQELATANGLRIDATIRAGQKLVIPTKPGATAPAAAAVGPGTTAAKSTTPNPAAAKSATGGAMPPAQKSGSGGGALIHVVQDGETLGTIAQRYQVKATDIAAENNLPNPNLVRVGMKLAIPGDADENIRRSQAPRGSQTAAGSRAGSATTTPAPAPVETMQTRPVSEIPIIRVDEISTGKR